MMYAMCDGMVYNLFNGEHGGNNIVMSLFFLFSFLCHYLLRTSIHMLVSSFFKITYEIWGIVDISQVNTPNKLNFHKSKRRV